MQSILSLLFMNINKNVRVKKKSQKGVYLQNYSYNLHMIHINETLDIREKNVERLIAVYIHNY